MGSFKFIGVHRVAVALATVCALILVVCLFSLPGYADEKNEGAVVDIQNKQVQAANDKQVTSTSAGSDEVAMHRLYNPNSGEHFYTASAAEKNNLKKAGWNYEGIGWFAPKSSKTPVYRMYNRNAGDHHYTPSASERDTLRKKGWRYEGIGWYSDDAKTTPVYRLYNKRQKVGSHHFTTSKRENDSLAKGIWRAEGIGWYALREGVTIKDAWVKEGGRYRWYDEDIPAKEGWIKTTKRPMEGSNMGVQKYRVNANGYLVTGFFKVAGKQYYGIPSKGHVAVSNGGYVICENQVFRANKDGVLTYDNVINRMVKKAQGYSSGTKYLIMTDIDDCRTVIFQGKKGAWKVKYVWVNCTGKPSTPTPLGVYSTWRKGYHFGENKGYTCYWLTCYIRWTYGFHSRIYYKNTHRLKVATLGKRISNGCIRLLDENAKWIYQNVKTGTTVVNIK